MQYLLGLNSIQLNISEIAIRFAIQQEQSITSLTRKSPEIRRLLCEMWVRVFPVKHMLLKNISDCGKIPLTDDRLRWWSSVNTATNDRNIFMSGHVLTS